jgi:hypothetical protein
MSKAQVIAKLVEAGHEDLAEQLVEAAQDESAAYFKKLAALSSKAAKAAKAARDFASNNPPDSVEPKRQNLRADDTTEHTLFWEGKSKLYQATHALGRAAEAYQRGKW